MGSLAVYGEEEVTGVLVLIGLVYGLSELDANRRGIDPRSAAAPPDVAPGDD